MGWANCGEDKNGRPIGYSHEATCDHDGCNVKIDRGLAYACGDMHGNTEYGCDKYFCSEHRENIVEDGDRYVRICNSCRETMLATGEFLEIDGAIVMVGAHD